MSNQLNINGSEITSFSTKKPENFNILDNPEISVSQGQTRSEITEAFDKRENLEISNDDKEVLKVLFEGIYGPDNEDDDPTVAKYTKNPDSYIEYSIENVKEAITEFSQLENAVQLLKKTGGTLPQGVDSSTYSKFQHYQNIFYKLEEPSYDLDETSDLNLDQELMNAKKITKITGNTSLIEDLQNLSEQYKQKVIKMQAEYKELGFEAWTNNTEKQEQIQDLYTLKYNIEMLLASAGIGNFSFDDTLSKKDLYGIFTDNESAQLRHTRHIDEYVLKQIAHMSSREEIVEYLYKYFEDLREEYNEKDEKFKETLSF